MINGMQFKVCGLTRLEDATRMAQLGADFFGFNFYAKSPRYLGLDRYSQMKDDLPDVPRVAVCVNPDEEALHRFMEAGFDYFQIHFQQDARALDLAKSWSESVTSERLWLAPKIVPGETFNRRLLDIAETILWDAYKKDAFGGTGKTSDWETFRELRLEYPEKRWILAGGLGPGNTVDAVASTGARVLDFNSGIESSPGEKDHLAMREVREILQSLKF